MKFFDLQKTKIKTKNLHTFFLYSPFSDLEHLHQHEGDADTLFSSFCVTNTTSRFVHKHNVVVVVVVVQQILFSLIFFLFVFFVQQKTFTFIIFNF